MTQHRISRLKVEKLADCLGYRLVTHQWLGDRKDYYYMYSVVRDEKATYKETLLSNKTLKATYDYLSDLLEIECRKMREETTK